MLGSNLVIYTLMSFTLLSNGYEPDIMRNVNTPKHQMSPFSVSILEQVSGDQYSILKFEIKSTKP